MKSTRILTALLCTSYLMLSTATAYASTFTPEQWVPYIAGNLQYANQQWYVENGNEPWSFSSPDNNTLHFELRAGDNWSGDNPASHQRTEIDGGPSTIATGTPIAISYQYELEPGPYISSSYFVTGQFHQTSQGVAGAGFSPPFSINTGQDAGSANNQEMSIMTSFENPPGSQVFRGIYFDPNPITRDHWYSMSIQVLFSDDSSGYAYVWRDGTQIAAYQGPIGFIGPLAEYWKEGIYRFPSTATEDADYRNLIIATSTTPVSASSTAPTVQVYVVPSIVVKGGSFAVVWDSLNATSCNTNGLTSHTDAAFAKLLTNAQSSQTYTVACTGAYGTATSSASVTVINPPNAVTNLFRLFGKLNLFGILQLH